MRELQKKMQQLENDLDQTQEKLMNANQRLEEKEKALQNVSHRQTTNLILSLFSSSLSSVQIAFPKLPRNATKTRRHCFKTQPKRDDIAPKRNANVTSIKHCHETQ